MIMEEDCLICLEIQVWGDGNTHFKHKCVHICIYKIHDIKQVRI